MQRHPLEFGSSDPGHTCGAFLPGNILEAVGFGDRRIIGDDFEERCANRKSDATCQLCGSCLPIRETAPPGRYRFLSLWTAVAGGAVLALRATRTKNTHTRSQLSFFELFLRFLSGRITIVIAAVARVT